MTVAAAAASQFVVSAANAAAPYIANAAANYAASQALTAAQNLIFGPVVRRHEGPRREEIRFHNAAEGAGIPRVYGRQRIGGQTLWITDFQEVTEVIKQSSGGKGITRSVETQHTVYRYTVSIAIGLCEGEISRLARVWADGRAVSMKDWNVRIYKGTEDQLPDPLIEAVEGVEAAPAYRGLAYLVIEDLPLDDFGNRVPQFNFEVERQLLFDHPEALENLVTAVTLIPGSGESVYSTTPLFLEAEEGVTQPDNIHSSLGETDATVSIDHLVSTFPHLEAVSLVVSWFGSDLRAGECVIEPRMEDSTRVLVPDEWSVAGVDREAATEVSRIDGAPAYGGTPSDKGVTEMIAALHDRGLEVMFHPFILMDIPAGNGLADPYGGEEQGAYPWRGRITAHPLASVDKTAAARTQIASFFTTYRPMILHYAALCAEAGGVESFLIGSELRELTRLRDETGAFPAVEELVTLAGEVRAILGAGTKISYGADWSEYGAYQPGDGSGDVLFPLDDLWADEDIDFIGIDNYMPLTDWRDGGGHLDAEVWDSPYDRDYLQARIAGGENYDWYYADQTARDAQTRTPISDTAHGEDWIFRSKDLTGWWGEAHFPRPDGVRAATPTAWVPESKPIRFTEIGCAAIDKGANQPNVFLDPKSAESAVPYYSSGERDDLAARRFLEAQLSYWPEEENNPASALYAGPMLSSDRLYLYAWDARPFPDFPARGDIWADWRNWVTGHWLNGRAGRVPLSALIQHIAADAGLTQVDASACEALVTGYMLGQPMTGRAALEPLFELYQLDAVERAGVLIVRPRNGISSVSITEDDMVITDENPPLTIARAQGSDLPAQLIVTYTDGFSDYQPGVATVTAPGAHGVSAARIDTAVVLEAGEAEGRAETLLVEARALRTSLSFALPSGDMTMEPSDVLTVEALSGELHDCRITSITDGPYRAIEAVRTDRGLFTPRYTGLSTRPGELPRIAGPAAFEILDIPLLPAGQDGAFLRAAAYAAPWPGRVNVYRGSGTEAALIGGVSHPASLGRLIAALGPGPVSRWDEGNVLRVRMVSGHLASLTEEAALNGAGQLAVRSTTGEWEILSFRDAVLEEDGSYTLRHLLRGQRGTEDEALAGAASGARVVMLGTGLEAEPLDPSLWGTEGIWQAGPAGKPPGFFPYREQTVQLTGSGARPFAPAHLTAAPSGDDLMISWVRRSRIGGDGWSAGDIPLGESSERYLVRTRAEDDTILHEEEVTSPSLTLAASGVARVEVRQVSVSFGPGRATFLDIG
ncbi:glycoside hydrolase TIM-barrel-like domain-containing protein [Parvularcula marina]|uniref:baseplate multidomain protein megatron n=1 Tax=Parvularcula marina TaxID=2292771 RepID=UPI0035128AAD